MTEIELEFEERVEGTNLIEGGSLGLNQVGATSRVQRNPKGVETPKAGKCRPQGRAGHRKPETSKGDRRSRESALAKQG